VLDSDLRLASKYYTIKEVNEILSTLDDPSWTKLMKAAEYKSYFYDISAEDLLQDVIEKLLSNKRNWPRDLDIFILFRNIIRSLLDNEKKKDKKELSLNDKNKNGDEFINNYADQKVDTEQELLLQQKREEISGLFKDDDMAKNIVDGRMENLKRGELLEILGLTEQEYDTKWKKIRRCITKEYPGGWQ